MKLSHMKLRYTYCKENPVFTTRAMWNLIKELERNPYEMYWDYKDELPEESIDLIEQRGLNGLYEVESELYELNWEYINDGQKEIMIENIPQSSLSDYKLSFLVSTLRKYREIDSEARADDLISMHYTELCDLSSDFEETMQDLESFQSYDMEIDDLFSNTTYEKSLWHEICADEIDDMFRDEIEEIVSKKRYEYNDGYKRDVYIKISYPQDTLEEIAGFFDKANRAYAKVTIPLNVTLTFWDPEIGDDVEIVCSEEIECFIDDMFVADSDEHVDDDYEDVFSMDISEVNLWYPSDADLDQWQVMFDDVPCIDKSDINMAEVKFVLDDNFYIVEAERAPFAGRGGLCSFKTFGFDRETNLWEKNTVTLIDDIKKPDNVVFINHEGNLDEEVLIAS